MNLKGTFYPVFVANSDRYSPEDRACIERVTERLCSANTSASHPGMLLGKIQSGKTKTFLAIMALAFDNEFDATVVLTKGTRALAKQTYQRIKTEFRVQENADRLKVFDIMTMPDNLTGYELNQKLVIVVKKQTDNLDRLIHLFNGSQYPAMKNKRVLIIDDEADYASIGFRKPKGEAELDINTTARQLEQLRTEVEQAAFLQVTATPYSLYLQPSNVQVRGISFKPIRPTFTELVPVSPDYVGSDYYFETSKDGKDLAHYIYRPVALKELEVLRKADGRRLKLDEVLSTKAIPSLREAICTFVVGGCIRRMQDEKAGKTPKKFSFLVHTESQKGAHAWQETLVDTIKQKLSEAASKDPETLRALVSAAYEDLAKSISLRKDFLPSEERVFEEVKKSLAHDHLMITKVNSEKQVDELLDEDGQLRLRTPLNIFIGGQILDRGVTIGNLIGFYYGRRPNVFQQDTVLQHSRMFGFRPKEDIAVTRFYTEPTIYKAMQRMHESDVALREAIAKNPEHEVVFIRKAPGDKVQPCSPNKIALSRTTTLKPHKRLLPVGFQTLAKTHLQKITRNLDALVMEKLGSHKPAEPKLLSVEDAISLLKATEDAFEFEESYEFDWEAARSSLRYLAGLTKDKAKENKVWVMAYSDRNAGRLAAETSHAEYIEPDSARIEGVVREKYAIDNPILILIRQNGLEEKGWKGGPFWWPIISAQKNTPTSIFAHETLGDPNTDE